MTNNSADTSTSPPTCPKCDSQKASRLRRSKFEKLLTGWTSFLKWECDRCYYRFWGKPGKPNQM